MRMNDDIRYVLHRRTEVEPCDLDAARGELVEVVLRWGAQILFVRHLGANERFVVSADPADRAADVFVDGESLFGAETLTTSRSWTCVQQSRGAWWICPTPVSAGEAFALASHATVALGALDLVVRKVAAPRAVVQRRKIDRTFAKALLSVTIVASALGTATVVTDHPFHPMLANEAQSDRYQWISHRLARSSRAPDAHSIDARGSDTRGARGEDDEPAPGAANARPSHARTNARRARGDMSESHRPRVSSREAVASRGIFAALGAFRPGRFDTAFDALRAPNDSVVGTSSLGETIADSFGFGGLGGGVASHGRGEESISACGCDGSIGFGTYGFANFGAGAYGERMSPAASAGARLRDRATGGPSVRTSGHLRVCGRPAESLETCAPSADNGRSPDSIRRVVQQHLGEIRHCFEQALVRNASAAGRVAVRFVIDPNGAVLGAMIDSNDMGDALLGRCASDAFRRWTFAPASSVVTVTYPLMMRAE
ncbi:MAG: AgmX/PglI C-terminal domain-containing protein [Deltaproteobacteria bacterium]|nr:AgmX/PglI C-terminal domain-containing protein [Deltaproteobacteria bacterium]